MMEQSGAEKLAFTLEWMAANESCSGLHPGEARKAAELLRGQERELISLRSALATKDHFVTVEVKKQSYRADMRAEFVITDPRIYYAESGADLFMIEQADDDWVRHHARHLTAVATRRWQDDLGEKAYIALRNALAPTEAGTAKTENTGLVHEGGE